MGARLSAIHQALEIYQTRLNETLIYDIFVIQLKVDFEDNITGKLRDLMRQEGLNANKQVLVPGGRLDILIKSDKHRIAIEGESFGPNKHVSAFKDACSRLGTNAVADIGVAVVYPEGCTEDSMTMDTRVTYAVVDSIIAYRYENTRNAAFLANTLNWKTSSVRQLIAAVSMLDADIGDPDHLIQELKQTLDLAVDLLDNTQRRNIARVIDPNTEKYNAAAKQGLLVIAAASLFHARLDEHLPYMKPDGVDSWPPDKLYDCKVEDTINRLLNAWQLIRRRDYKPIFLTGQTVLKSNTGPQFASSVRKVVAWALKAVGDIAGLKHDLLGRIFHVVLEDSRYDGSFYTSVPAATLLAGITIRNRRDVPPTLNDFKVMDPACGTGTLLMAAADRMRSVMGSEEYDPTVIIDSVLKGRDINTTALHLAATTLGLLSPTTSFSNMDIRKSPFGIVAAEHVDGTQKAAAGSLEMFEDGGLLPHLGWTGEGASANIESGEREAAHKNRETMDLLIMNPPFTSNDKRHHQFGHEVADKIKERESVIFKNVTVKLDKSSSGQLFLMLAQRLTKDNGTIALVLPLSAATNPSSQEIREMFAQKRHIDMVIVPYDPERIWFSENTTIAEILVIMRSKRAGPTKIVRLKDNPKTATDAASLASSLLNGNGRKRLWVSTNWPQEMMRRGDWLPVQFFSPHLINLVRKARSGKLFCSVSIDDIATIQDARSIRATFRATDMPPEDGSHMVLYYHDTEHVTTLCPEPTHYMSVKAGKEKSAKAIWSKMGHLQIPERLRFNTTHVGAVRTDAVSAGSAWFSVRCRNNDEGWSKAMAVWFNSSVGLAMLLSIRTDKGFTHAWFPITYIKTMPVPDLDTGQIQELVCVFDEYSSRQLCGWGEIINDAVRRRFDNAVCDVVGINQETMARTRQELAREPTIIDRKYGEPVNTYR